MLDSLRARYHAVLARLRRFERREVSDLRRWLEHTSNLVHVSVLLFVPLLIGVVTALSNAVGSLSFLLFPPLAAGTYTLFAEPEGRYASPWRFVAGLTAGALCGWFALEATALYVYGVRPGQLSPHAGAAALSVFLTGAVTWALDVEEPAAFSTALLVLVTGTTEFEYVVSVAAASAIVAGVFVVWREEFYEERSRYLYRSTRGDDHVLVPMRGPGAGTAAMLGARLAAAHEAGKVVLLEVLPEAARGAVPGGEGGASARGEQDGAGGEQRRTGGDGRAPDADTGRGGRDADAGRGRPDAGAEDAASETAADAASAAESDDAPPSGPVAASAATRRLEAEADRIETRVGVPCEVVVAAGADEADVALRTARETGCDLVVAPFDAEDGPPSGYVRRLFRSETDVVAVRASGDRTEWRDVMVAVRRAGAVAHAMVDFARRLAGPTGRVSVCTCIDRESRRRAAESMLASLVETYSGRFETRVAKTSVERFVERNAPAYDLVVVGASTDRSAASRFLSPPTFERVSPLDADVAVVHRGRP